MRIARLAIEKQAMFGDVRFMYRTWPCKLERFHYKFAILIMPDSYYALKMVELDIRTNHEDIIRTYTYWNGALIAKALKEASTHSLTKEEIYPSSLKNKHILTVKQSIYYAWRNIKQSAKRLLRPKKCITFKYTSGLWMGN